MFLSGTSRPQSVHWIILIIALEEVTEVEVEEEVEEEVAEVVSTMRLMDGYGYGYGWMLDVSRFE
jgi:hypothetical protein